jgi:hypothetical protein
MKIDTLVKLIVKILGIVLFLKLLNYLKELYALGFLVYEYNRDRFTGFTVLLTVLFVIGIMGIFIVLTWLCLYRTNVVVSWLGLKQGFDLETESSINLSSASIIRIAIITLGGYLFITTIASFIQSILDVIKIPSDIRDFSVYSNCIIDAVYLIIGGIMLSFNAEITERILNSTKDVGDNTPV